MGWEAWFMLALLALVLAGLIANRPPDAVLVAAMTVCAAAGIISPADALSGFANTGLITVAALFVVAAALRETGALDTLGRFMLGKVKTERGVLVRMSVFVTTISAFMNNTPIVAMFLPVLESWSRKNNVAPSRLLMPLSFLAILGGTCTLIGTSTNLVVAGMMKEEAKARTALAASVTEPAVAAQHEAIAQSLRPLGLFELGYVGAPFALIGIAYLLTAGSWLLPRRKDFRQSLDDASREYLVNLRITPGCALSGKQVEEAGLRHLKGLFLIEIDRSGEIISPVGPRQTLESGDVLTFTGVIGNIVELERIPGLLPVADEDYIAEAIERRHKMLCEAVISTTSPMIGKSVREGGFRSHYNAAIVAVSRGGERLKGRVGDIVLRSGDTLLLQTGENFQSAHRNNPDFFLVSGVDESRAVRHDKAYLSIALLLLLVSLMTFGAFGDPVLPSLLIAGALVVTRCISTSLARQSLDWQTLITIGASFGVGKALVESGLVTVVATTVSESMLGLGPYAPFALLAAFYLITSGVTETVTNNAAAALMFPFAVEMGERLGVDPRPFVLAVCFAASAAFITPIGYQTHLMVYGPGGYRFSDFVRVGTPLNILLMITATILIPLVWPFHP